MDLSAAERIIISAFMPIESRSRVSLARPMLSANEGRRGSNERKSIKVMIRP